MATVPYNPVPTVSPGGGATPSISVNAPPAAFGGDVGLAMQGLSRTLEGTGDELAKRALAMQELTNRTDADAASVEYAMKAGELHAAYQASMGKNSVNGLKQYYADLQKIREETGGALTNPAARRLYDSETRPSMARSMFSGASHAATENKRYIIGTTEAKISKITNDTLHNPQDKVLFKDGIKAGEEQIETQAGIAGWSDEQTAEQKAKFRSSLLLSSIVGLSNNKPAMAKEALETNRAYLRAEDLEKAEKVVTQNLYTTGSRTISMEVNADLRQDADATKELPLADRLAIAREKAKKVAPEDVVFQQRVEQQVEADYRRQKQVFKDTERQHEETIQEVMQKSNPKDVDALVADPAAREAFESLPAKKQNEIPGILNRYNAAVNKQTQQETLTRLVGMANNDPEVFLSIDVTKEKLSQSDMRRVMEMQAKKKKNVDADPRVTRAVGWLRTSRGAELEALGIYRRTESNKDVYDKYVGTLQTAIEAWTEAHGKPPGAKDLTEEIGPQVIRQRDEPGMLWGTNKKPFFDQTVPKEFKRGLTESLMKSGGSEPTDEQVYRAYIRSQLKKLYYKPSSNLTAPGTTITGMSIVDAPIAPPISR